MTLIRRCVSPETWREVCQGRWDGGAAVPPLQRVRSWWWQTDLGQSHHPGEGSDQWHVISGADGDGRAGSWKESCDSQCLCKPSWELLMLPGVKQRHSRIDKHHSSTTREISQFNFRGLSLSHTLNKTIKEAQMIQFRFLRLKVKVRAQTC